MKLLRLATIHIEPQPESSAQYGLRMGPIGVSVMGEWREEGKLKLLVVAQVPLSRKPRLDKGRAVSIPQRPREGAETAIRAYANIIATSWRARRHIASPSPYVAFLPETASETRWLESTAGIKAGFHGIPGSNPPVESSDEIIRGLMDRLDGLDLCAEALSQPTAAGKFRDFVRLFERGFAEDRMKRLAPLLARFLKGSGHGYTLREARDWLEKRRHHLVHAGRRGRYMLESDIAPVVRRVEQAAYDVLFNKGTWNSSSTERRDLWSPSAGTIDSEGRIFVTQGVGATLNFQIFDRLAGFVGDVSTHLNSLPQGWWAREARDELPPKAPPPG